jgi:hypothetical protein
MDRAVKTIAAVQGASSAVVRDMFRALVARWQSSARIAGVLEEHHGQDNHGQDNQVCGAGYLRSIASGARYSMFQDQHQSRRPWRHLFFLAVSAARRAAHTGHEVDGITAGGVPSPGRRNAGIVPWTSVPWTYSHSVNASGSRVLRLGRSTRSKASRRSIMLL